VAPPEGQRDGKGGRAAPIARGRSLARRRRRTARGDPAARRGQRRRGRRARRPDAIEQRASLDAPRPDARPRQAEGLAEGEAGQAGADPVGQLTASQT
jgi:hypothetical protein